MEQLFRRGPTARWAPGRGRPWWGMPCCGPARQAGYVLIDYLGSPPPGATAAWGGEILRLLQEKFRAWEGILVESGGPGRGARGRPQPPAAGGFTSATASVPCPYDCLLFGGALPDLPPLPQREGGPRRRPWEAHRGLLSQLARGPMRSLWRSPGPHLPCRPGGLLGGPDQPPRAGGREKG